MPVLGEPSADVFAGAAGGLSDGRNGRPPQSDSAALLDLGRKSRAAGGEKRVLPPSVRADFREPDRGFGYERGA